MVWKYLEGNERHYSSLEVWHTIRLRNTPISWANMVWFSQCILRHSFQLWLVIKNKLKTQDRLKVWEAGSEKNLRLVCFPLCQHDRDSRDHLFFSCKFASQVWMNIKSMVDMAYISDSWNSVLEWMEQYSNSKRLEQIVCKLVLAAVVYFIWQERNNRLFSQLECSAIQVTKKIKDYVRLRLMGFKYQGHVDHNKVLKKWQIPLRALDGDPG
ncbi:putative reverse transcriptase zinc-binding domain-containing protein [Helianthus anomalus]